MGNPSFTRDEAILALDVLYSASKERTNMKKNRIENLCSLLKRLPIHPNQTENTDFRTPKGVSTQLSLFKRSMEKGEKHPHVGQIFFTVAFEFEDKLEELHKIAAAIRNNEAYFTETYGASPEGVAFQEGNLLGHLHCSVESQAMNRLHPGDRCEVCNLQPDAFYQNCNGLLRLHLLVPPTEIDGNQKYDEECFITVCPTCHRALHISRPWLTKENIGEILR